MFFINVVVAAVDFLCSVMLSIFVHFIFILFSMQYLFLEGSMWLGSRGKVAVCWPHFEKRYLLFYIWT